MSDRKNEILEEQRIARQKFLELKKMQKGEMQPEAKPSEIEVKPKTFAEKWKNFWYHSKWQTIVILFFAVSITILTVQCTKREKYDFKVVYFGYDMVLDAQLDPVEEYIESLAQDINNDNKVNIEVINCSLNGENKNAAYNSTALTKVQSVIVATDDAVMYIVDEKAEEYLSGIAEGDLFEKPPFLLDEKFYETTKSEQFGFLPKNLKVANRRIKGTLLEDNEVAKTTFAECERIISKLK